MGRLTRHTISSRVPYSGLQRDMVAFSVALSSAVGCEKTFHINLGHGEAKLINGVYTDVKALLPKLESDTVKTTRDKISRHDVYALTV